MTAVIPPRFLFRWAWSVSRRDDLPQENGQRLALEESLRCFSLTEFDGGPGLADLRLAWNTNGLGLAVEVRGKQDVPACQPMTPTGSDHVMLWLDTRSTQTVHRATRYCHQFCFLPTGSGKKRDLPSVTNLSMVRGVEESKVNSAKGTDSPVQVWSELLDDGYRLEAWLPSVALFGFDPDSYRQLGFYLAVRDSELGDQFLTVGREFPFEHDPSLWQVLELAG